MLLPWSMWMISTRPCCSCHTATHEYVVPRSIPTAHPSFFLAIIFQLNQTTQKPFLSEIIRDTTQQHNQLYEYETLEQLRITLFICLREWFSQVKYNIVYNPIETMFFHIWKNNNGKFSFLIIFNGAWIIHQLQLTIILCVNNWLFLCYSLSFFIFIKGEFRQIIKRGRVDEQTTINLECVCLYVSFHFFNGETATLFSNISFYNFKYFFRKYYSK